jgi:hypothetical protein
VQQYAIVTPGDAEGGAVGDQPTTANHNDAAAASAGGNEGRLLSKLFGSGADDSATGAAATTNMNTGDPSAAFEELQGELEAAKGVTVVMR